VSEPARKNPSPTAADAIEDEVQEAFYDSTPGIGFKLSPMKDAAAMADICTEYPNVLQDALMMHCNAPLLILRVLHKFGIHPHLKSLRKLDWKQIKGGRKLRIF
jgi:hypothetical protein